MDTVSSTTSSIDANSYDALIVIVCISLATVLITFALIFCCVSLMIQRAITVRSDENETELRIQIARINERRITQASVYVDMVKH
ncbi:hypothetical protein QR680_016242 [Steinernema hermaphroditum]|uniref:Uncharacterized protein n=1 Tax=Steinernema hermaphroditum TaxID=289476 RepID=A0AA39LLM9_9BILA|nr:hypothetical protein QR680_016242 [Steinernema hermaphroditum]